MLRLPMDGFVLDSLWIFRGRRMWGSLWQSILLQLVDVLRQKLSRLPPPQFPSLLGSVDAARLCSAEKTKAGPGVNSVEGTADEEG